MQNPFKRLWDSEKGSTIIIAAATLPLVVGASGLATDTIQWALWKRQLQRAADSAAIAGVYTRTKNDNETAVRSAVDTDISLNHHTGIALLAAPTVALLANSGDMRERVQVGLQIRKALPFSAMFMTAAPIIRANAIAASVPGTDEYCVITLEPSASKTGITVGGNTSISMNCGMISNSPSANSALSNGNSSSVTASVIAAVGAVQASSQWNVAKYDPYTTPVKDPYESVNPTASEMSGCPANPPSASDSTSVPSGAATLCYSSINVGSNRTWDLGSNKTIYVTGHNKNTAGDVTVQGTLNCTNCTIVLTNKDMASDAKIGTFDMQAQGKMNISAPSDASNKYRGIAVFQDRRAVDASGSGSPNKFNGGGSQIIQGALYFPNQSVTYNGSGTATAVCTRFVSRRIIFTGNSAATNYFEKGSNCGIFGNDGISGGRRVRLVA
ncbi:Tad domain-containing protein [Sphingomonas xanthus]|uniref:Putative Flp pilus-assembly TadG-like N-terminal domain-containing protein n=1 Tax=Sphingomonas xanthus TaxID=2594473 RepID=A0A516IPN0_9SPHN|nr:Tad domain-containing protein [Sphingomonas xanthus]QDP18885.1 hypothetical protein FMM02_02250 [Sphingomonas xanthus]